MLDRLLGIVAWYSQHWIANGSGAEIAPFYGWLATASFVVLLVTIIGALLGKVRGGDGIRLVGQHVLVLGLPYLWSAVVA